MLADLVYVVSIRKREKKEKKKRLNVKKAKVTSYCQASMNIM